MTIDLFPNRAQDIFETQTQLIKMMTPIIRRHYFLSSDSVKSIRRYAIRCLATVHNDVMYKLPVGVEYDVLKVMLGGNVSNIPNRSKLCVSTRYGDDMPITNAEYFYLWLRSRKVDPFETSRFIFAPSGSGKTYFINSMRIDWLVDIDDYIDFPEGKWWLTEQGLSNVESQMFYIKKAYSGLVFLSGIGTDKFRYDLYIQLPYEDIKRNMIKRITMDPNTKQGRLEDYDHDAYVKKLIGKKIALSFIDAFIITFNEPFKFTNGDKTLWQLYKETNIYSNNSILGKMGFKNISILRNDDKNAKYDGGILLISGHLLNILLVSHYGLVDINRYMDSIIINMSGKHSDFEDKPGIWHSWIEYYLAVAAYIVFCGLIRMPIHVVAIKLVLDKIRTMKK